jgi:thiamine biosynthesis lipoprotein
MGTEIEVLAAPSLNASTAGRIRRFFESIESQFSRFRPDSELSRLNASAGKTFPATPKLRHVLQRAIRAAGETGGLFDPTILPPLEAAGYSRDFTSLAGRAPVRVPLKSRCAGYGEITVSAGGEVRMPADCKIDLGGYVKGWTVDRAARYMASSETWCINAGGDLLARGHGPEGLGWMIGVEDPHQSAKVLATISVVDAAIATSSTVRRRWKTETGAAHHLIDPRTGRPSDTDLASVTVMASRAADAEVLSKQLILLGSHDGHLLAETREMPAFFVDRSGAVTLTSKMEEHIVG